MEPILPAINMPLVGLSLIGVTVIAFHQSKKEVFPPFWKYLVGGGMISVAVIMNLRVQSIRTEFTQAHYLTILSFAWLMFCAALLWNQKKKEAKWFAIIPILAIGIGRASTLLAASHVEEAQVRGDSLILRIDRYSEAEGEYPRSLQELSVFDNKELPTTGVGFWSTQQFQYLGWETGYSLSFFGLAHTEYSRSSSGPWREVGQ